MWIIGVIHEIIGDHRWAAPIFIVYQRQLQSPETGAGHKCGTLFRGEKRSEGTQPLQSGLSRALCAANTVDFLHPFRDGDQESCRPHSLSSQPEGLLEEISYVRAMRPTE
jgi:hypothetical protein